LTQRKQSQIYHNDIAMLSCSQNDNVITRIATSPSEEEHSDGNKAIIVDECMSSEPPALVQESHDPQEIPVDCTLSYFRALTAPPIDPPSVLKLKTELLAPWNLRIPVDTTDAKTCSIWGSQKRSKLFHELFDWNAGSKKKNHQSVKLQPFLTISATPSPFVSPAKEVGLCLRQLLFCQLGCRQKDSFLALTSFAQCVFLATTGPGYIEQEIWTMNLSTAYYLMRCHYNPTQQQLLFGYHITSKEGKDPRKDFHTVIAISLSDVDWRLRTCKVLVNVARILNSLVGYGIPLTCQPDKRCIMNGLVVKSYESNHIICGNPSVTVENMVAAYRMLVAHKVPHTDQLISVEERTKSDIGIPTKTFICCSFGPIGRTYQPRNLGELLDALVCVAEVLVSVHSMGWMHRDIRWDNVFHAFKNYDASTKKAFSNEWILFDFEFAASSPQPSFEKYTMTTGNHAPEMFASKASTHSAAVDIWGLGYLIQSANVDVALSHADDLQLFMRACLGDDPEKRPKIGDCLETLRMLKRRPCSPEKDVVVPC
jgi:hypothetical protein